MNAAPKSYLKSLPSDDTQGNSQPIRAAYAWRFSSGAIDSLTRVTSWPLRWGMTASKWSATNEQPVQPGFRSSTRNPEPNMK